jgi:hypothetical protein
MGWRLSRPHRLMNWRGLLIRPRRQLESRLGAPVAKWPVSSNNRSSGWCVCVCFDQDWALSAPTAVRSGWSPGEKLARSIGGGGR